MKLSDASAALFRILAVMAVLVGQAHAQRVATATATVFNQFVVGVVVTDGGSGYGWAPSVTIAGGGGAGAGAFATVSNGAVTSITVTNAGAGYTNTPQVMIGAPSTTPFGSSLVLDLPLDGSVMDLGPNSFTVLTNGGGTNGGGTFAPDRFAEPNSALALNGVNQNIYLPFNALLYPDERTLSFWAQFPQFTGTIWRAGNASSDSWRGFELLLAGTTGSVQYNDYTGSGFNATPLAAGALVSGQWCQIVVTRASNSCAIFVNGSKVASQTGLTPYAKPHVTPMSLGANNNLSGGGFWNFCPMTLDSVHIFNRALADSEVSLLYSNEVARVPSITTQPRDALVNAYDPASFSVTATGTRPLYYRWYMNDSNVVTGTTNALSIAHAKQADLGAYYVIVTNNYGSVTSSVATLSMYPFIAVPFTGLDTYWGQSNTLTVGAWGSGPLSYQWYFNGAALADATNQALTLPAIEFTNAGLYSVVVTSSLGSVTNATCQVIVNPADVSLGLFPGVIITGTVGYNYTIQGTTDLANTNGWITLTNITLTQPVQIWSDFSADTTKPANPRKFYRVLPGQ